nr:uncharacterized protein LOC113802357 isoform X6 [Penaeus vannamei]
MSHPLLCWAEGLFPIMSKNLKIVTVGDGGVGKTSLLVAYTQVDAHTWCMFWQPHRDRFPMYTNRLSSKTTAARWYSTGRTTISRCGTRPARNTTTAAESSATPRHENRPAEERPVDLVRVEARGASPRRSTRHEQLRRVLGQDRPGLPAGVQKCHPGDDSQTDLHPTLM